MSHVSQRPGQPARVIVRCGVIEQGASYLVAYPWPCPDPFGRRPGEQPLLAYIVGRWDGEIGPEGTLTIRHDTIPSASVTLRPGAILRLMRFSDPSPRPPRARPCKGRRPEVAR